MRLTINHSEINHYLWAFGCSHKVSTIDAKLIPAGSRNVQLIKSPLSLFFCSRNQLTEAQIITQLDTLSKDWKFGLTMTPSTALVNGIREPATMLARGSMSSLLSTPALVRSAIR